MPRVLIAHIGTKRKCYLRRSKSVRAWRSRAAAWARRCMWRVEGISSGRGQSRRARSGWGEGECTGCRDGCVVSACKRSMLWLGSRAVLVRQISIPWYSTVVVRGYDDQARGHCKRVGSYSAFHWTCRLGADSECAATCNRPPHLAPTSTFNLRYLFIRCTFCLYSSRITL
ncbi:hypothetical protein GSI_13222 [Ganoderma sinense ZZ0214-1]|uniref:Uncharacterized protein n=1 Tax=Ganoderma sinense ZZ0214-1 TaxID=1077348 RepID=A0A2G8RV02_9APHY|nr:hypothetical protein GSI_13222 [Ganoderma sinense ZZ0214-1]